MMIEESQRVGWLMKKKLKWHRLQMKREKMISAQQKERLLRMIEYLEKDLKTETSTETKGSNDFTSDDFCMFVGKTCGGGKTVDVVTKEENETARYVVNVHTQFGRSFSFQYIGSRGDLNCDDGQKLEIEKSIGQIE